MGVRDSLRKSIGDVTRLARETVNDGAEAVSGWVAERETNRRLREFDDRLMKAAEGAARQGNDGTHELQAGSDGKPARDPKSLHFDPFDIVAAMGFRERPSALTYQAMEMVGRTTPVIADVIRARISQVSMFCEVPEDRHSPGFKVRLRDWKNNQMSDAAEKEADRLEQFLLYTGNYDIERPWDAVPLRDFASMAISDTLMYDQLNFEIVPDRQGNPAYFSIVDPTTVRLLDPGFRNPGDPFCVQVINGLIVADFMREELAFCVRNPRSGIRSYGYGISEIETLVKEITGFLWAMHYNRSFFTNGSATKGILNFKGTIPDRHLQSFRRQWYSMITGVTNAWRTPITNAEELQWINLQMNNRDMEYSAWMDFLIKIVCARYQIAPEEVNFQYGNTGQSQAMGTSPVEEKVKASKDLGLRPLVRWFFVQLNQHVIQRLNPDFEVIPCGMSEKGVEAETELLQKQTSIYLTVDEAREAAELPPIGPEGGGDAILNPTWLQWAQGKRAEAQQAQMQQQGMPQPGEEGGPGGPPLPPQNGMGSHDPDAVSGENDMDFGVHDNETGTFDVDDDQALKSDRQGEPLIRYVVDL